MRHAVKRRARHAMRGRDLQREYRQAVAVQNMVYRQWLDGVATYEGYIAARTAVHDVVQEMQPMRVGEYRRPPEAGTPAARHPFYDPLSDRGVVLVIGPDRDSTGVEHEGCEALADVSPELDVAFCTKCHWQCRISGAWFLDLLEADR